MPLTARARPANSAIAPRARWSRGSTRRWTGTSHTRTGGGRSGTPRVEGPLPLAARGRQRARRDRARLAGDARWFRARARRDYQSVPASARVHVDRSSSDVAGRRRGSGSWPKPWGRAGHHGLDAAPTRHRAKPPGVASADAARVAVARSFGVRPRHFQFARGGERGPHALQSVARLLLPLPHAILLGPQRAVPERGWARSRCERSARECDARADAAVGPRGDAGGGCLRGSVAIHSGADRARIRAIGRRDSFTGGHGVLYARG